MLVADAARDFLRILERVESTHEPTLLVREGRPVAQIVPVPDSTLHDYQKAISLWEERHRLESEEARTFADDLALIRANQAPLKSPWD